MATLVDWKNKIFLENFFKKQYIILNSLNCRILVMVYLRLL